MKNTTRVTQKPKKPQRPALLWLTRVLVFTAGAMLAAGIIFLEQETSLLSTGYSVGEPSSRTLFSPFTARYMNEAETKAFKKRAAESVLEVYSVDPSVKEENSSRLNLFFQTLVQTSDPGVPVSGENVLPFDVSDSTVKLLRDDPDLEEVRLTMLSHLQRQWDRGILTEDKKFSLLEDGVSAITVKNEMTGSEAAAPVREVLSSYQLKDLIFETLPDRIQKKRNLRNGILEVLNSVVTPNLEFDADATLKRQQEAANAVTGVEKEIKKGELIVQRGMLVTPEVMAKINVIMQKMAKREILHKLQSILLLVFAAYTMLFFYLFVFHRKLLLLLRMNLLIHSIILTGLVLCKIIYIWPGSVYLMPTVLSGLLVTLLLNAQLGIFVSMVTAVLVAPMTNYSLDIVLATMLGGIAASLVAFRVRKRVHFIRVTFGTGLISGLVFFAYRIFQEYTPMESLPFFAWGVANAVMTTALVFLVLPLLELTFNVITDITLLELSDLNHPLLKRMVIEAPGTYHHSLVVSRLAESACENIGANELLARVGAYFHDIGKIAKAEYFTENRLGAYPSKHDKLTPTMSCLLIINHVKDGIELGKKHKLPQPILSFIPEHQGTGVVYYFYRKAMDDAKPGERISAEDFRYPGPKPQSRETAVTLLADSVEAASRSLGDPSAEGIRKLVRKVINDKFIDGQLDECNLTLRDLHRIQESFVHNLMAILHTRVSYPVAPEDPNKPDLFVEGQFQKFRSNPNE